MLSTLWTSTSKGEAYCGGQDFWKVQPKNLQAI